MGLPLAIGEEYGWRGLRVCSRSARFKATLLLATIWALWHLPLLAIGLNYPNQPLWAVLPVFVASVVVTAFPFTWLYVDSRGSVLVVAVMHSVLNSAGDTFTSPSYIPDANPLIVSGGGLVGAVLLLFIAPVWGAHRYRPGVVPYSPLERRQHTSPRFDDKSGL